MSDAHAFPEVALINPPAVAVGARTPVEVHLSRPAPADPPMCVAVSMKGERGVRNPLEPNVDTITRCQLEPTVPGIIDVCVCFQDSSRLGQRGVLLALPTAACGDLCGLPEAAAEHVRGRDAEFLSCFLDLTVEQATSLEARDLERRIRRAVWKKNSQELSKDLGSYLSQLWNSPPGVLPARAREKLHDVVGYLVQNRCWEAASFLLKTSLEHGVEISVCGATLTEHDIEPRGLQAVMGRLQKALGREDL
ncbi:unnamed protein product [Ostreobium quekettii]|uniref:Uncharacterized protein n=1 Tax=Ostreobium quekettii TaxID=121088 RepID=A0A8S1J0R9_9CHLO|nr:unnamed protein product [Ostreobium quekettii]